MTRRETVLRKLQSLPEDEVEEAIKQLTHHVKARLRFGSKVERTKSGAHSAKNLGMDPIDYYVGESVKRLYDPNGWDWKFEKFTLAQQLMRIANKLISDKVADYKAKQWTLPVFDERDAGDIYDLQEIAANDAKGNEESYTKLIQFAYEVSLDDDDLQYFVIRYFEKASFATIATEMNIEVKKVYVLRKKLVRKLMEYKEELTT
jgi:hypothetical protein